jgi:hypothetical protein
MADTWEIRSPSHADTDALADLKIEWSAPDREPTIAQRGDFSHALNQWMSRLGDSLICRVAAVEGRVVGMAWIVVFDRVPNFGQAYRLAADLQSVYVIPEFRGLRSPSCRATDTSPGRQRKSASLARRTKV